MPQYLIKQRQGWYATLEVPKSLREKIGKARFKQTLETDSLKVAEVRKHVFVAHWKSEIEAVKGNSTNLDKVVLVSHKRKQSVKCVSLRQHKVDTFGTTKHFLVTQNDIEQVEPCQKDITRTFPLKRFVTDYEKSLSHIEAKSKDMRLSDIKRFLKKFKYAEEATNREVKDWIEHNLIVEEGLSANTCRKVVSNLRQYWKYLVDKKDLNLPEPFKDAVPPRTKTRKQEVAEKRKHFEPEDYQKLINAAQDKEDSQLCSLIQLGAYTGCRIEELCSLKIDKVKDDRLLIEDAKTETGWRVIPIHESIADLVATLKAESKDNYLISGLSYNKYGDRSNALGKRFGKLKLKLGYGSNFVFHSFRKGVATQWERLGIAENISANLMGHDIPTMTYGLYSGNNLDFTLLKDTINKLNWITITRTE